MRLGEWFWVSERGQSRWGQSQVLGESEAVSPRGPVPIPRHPSLPSRLTAFVLKVLSLAQEQVGGSPEKLQETAAWLLLQQKEDGSFHDPCPVIHRDMQVRGWEAGPRRPGRSLPLPPPG